MTPWTGWERRESHASSALLLSLPKLDVSYRKAQANKLDLSTLVQIQVSSAWFCSCLYGNDLASVNPFLQCCKISGSGIRIWSDLIYSETILQHWVRNSKLNLQPRSLLLVLRCWTIGHPVILLSLENLPQDWTYRECAGFPLCHCSVQFIQVKSQDRMGLLFRCCAGNSMKTSEPSQEASFQCSDLTLGQMQGELRTWALNLDVSLGSDLLIPVLSLFGGWDKYLRVLSRVFL